MVNKEYQHHHLEEAVKLILRFLIPTILLISGIVLLTFSYSPWGTIIGFPMLIIGVVFLIYTYDEVICKETINTLSGYYIKCLDCGRYLPDINDFPSENILCPSCKMKKTS